MQAYQIDPSQSVILDLACGTGTLAIALTKQGCRVIGLEQSEAMLAVARQKAQRSELYFSEGLTGIESMGTGGESPFQPEIRLNWLNADMRRFQLPLSVDVTLCYSDSLNHLLSPADLEKCFQCVFQSLRPGGLFLFDLNTLDNFRTHWTGRDVSEGPNYRLTITAGFDESTGRANAEIMAEEYADDGPQDGLRVTEEDVFEQYYPDETLKKLLIATGFEVESVALFNPLTDMENIAEAPFKTFWVCRK